MAKLTKQQKSEILYLIDMNLSYEEIAKEYNVNRSTIFRFVASVNKNPIRDVINNKLSATDIPRIFKQKSLGNSLQKIADSYGVTKSTIQKVLNGKTWKDLSRKGALDDIDVTFQQIKSKGFPYIQMTDNQLGDLFSRIIRSQLSVKNNAVLTPFTGIQIINHHHKDIQSVVCGNKLSPVDAFNNDELLLRSIRNSIIKRGFISDSYIRSEINGLIGVQKASNFPPATAKAIYKYFNPTNILDFSAGWGGRMLGAMSLDLPYTGLDPSTNAITNNKLMLSKIESLTGKKYNVNLIQTCAEDYLGKGLCKPDLIFTSPPYFDTEKYSEEPTQSYIKFPTKDKWCEGFLKKCIEGAYSDLLPGGHLVINIDYKLALFANYYAMSAGFEMLHPLSMMLSSRAFVGKKPGRGPRSEPILVFKKGI